MLTTVDLLSPAPLPKASDYLVYPWLMPGRLTLMVGATEIGKTTLTLEIIAQLSKGGHLWDRYPARKITSVLYLHAEHSLHTVQEAAAVRNDIPPGLVNVVHEFGPIGSSLLEDGKPNLLLIKEIRNTIDKLSPNLIIAEPISAFLGVSENDNREARAVISILTSFGNQCNAAVLTHHHVGKSHFDPDHLRTPGIPVGVARGAQAFEDAAEKVIYLKRTKVEGQLRLETPKPKGYPVSPVTLSFDEDTLSYHHIPQFTKPDLIAVYNHRRSLPDLTLTDCVEVLRQQWKCSNEKVWLLVRRCQRLGLLTQDGSAPNENSLSTVPSRTTLM